VESIVCIKQVLDPDCQLELSKGGQERAQFGTCCRWFEITQPRYTLNPYDRVALEAAVGLREQTGRGQVTAVTIGPPRAQAVLHYALAAGADQALHIWDNALEDADAYLTAMVLAHAIRRLDCDLIICGQRSIDTGIMCVAAKIAETLALPYICGVDALELADRGSIIAHHCLDGAWDEIVRCRLPAVISVGIRMNQPRYPNLRRYRQALKTDIPILSLDSLGLTTEALKVAGPVIQIWDVSASRRLPRRIFVPGSHLPVDKRTQLILSGGIRSRRGQLICAPAEHAAGEVMRFLRERGLLQGD